MSLPEMKARPVPVMMTPRMPSSAAMASTASSSSALVFMRRALRTLGRSMVR